MNDCTLIKLSMLFCRFSVFRKAPRRPKNRPLAEPVRDFVELFVGSSKENRPSSIELRLLSDFSLLNCCATGDFLLLLATWRLVDTC